MKPRGLAVLSAALFALVSGIAVGQPRPLPASPDEARLMETYPSLRDARDVGAGVVITGVRQFGCAEGALQIDYAVVIFDPTQAYALNIVVRSDGVARMNQRLIWIIPSGSYTTSVAFSNSGGQAFDIYPLTPGNSVIVEMIFSEESGKPLWFSSMTVADCDGSPNTTSGFIAKPVTILNKNPKFQPSPSNPTVASKWTPSGKVTYSCAGSGVCTQKLKGKAGKTAQITQNLKLKPDPLPIGTRFGAAVSFDGTELLSGSVHVIVELTQSGTSNLQLHSFQLFKDVATFPTGDAVFVPSSLASVVPLDRLSVRLPFADTFLGGEAAGKLKVMNVYVYAVTP